MGPDGVPRHSICRPAAFPEIGALRWSSDGRRFSTELRCDFVVQRGSQSSPGDAVPRNQQADMTEKFVFDGPNDARATILLAHGAGAPMDSASMTATAKALAAAGFR